ncbi:hypothetical protein [Vibrio phage VP4B]|uniref:Uncharacterized protein n=1 Tax=Vibrio phage VP4B TaxID=1262540 RepID=V9LZH8_9CAUD|nr:hypothetical protein FDJ61_gp173 [Vibrio phage VP4B]AGB07287.1 hypothetical protein [Vibrio phage VP4B]
MSKKATKVKVPEVKEETVVTETAVPVSSVPENGLKLAHAHGVVVLADGTIHRVDAKTQDAITLKDLRLNNYRITGILSEIDKAKAIGYPYKTAETTLGEEKLYKVVDSDEYQIWMDESSVVDLSTSADDCWGGFISKEHKQKVVLYALNSKVEVENLDVDTTIASPETVVINTDLKTTTLVSSVIGGTLHRAKLTARSVKNSVMLLSHGTLEADHIENSDLTSCSGNIRGSIRDSEMTRCYLNTTGYSSISGCRLDNVNMSARSITLGKHMDKGYWARMPMKDFHFYDDGVDMDISRAFETGKTGAGLGRFEILFFPVRKNNKIEILLQSQQSNDEYTTPTTYIGLDESRMSIREKVTAILFPNKTKKRDEDGLHNRAMRNTVESSIIDEAVGVLHGRISLINQARLMASI